MTSDFKFQWLRAALSDADLSWSARAIGARLFDYASGDGSKVYPGNERLANDLSTTTRTIERGMSALRDAGWIERTRFGSHNGRRALADEYRLRIPDSASIPEAPDGVESPDNSCSSPSDHPTVVSGDPDGTPDNSDENTRQDCREHPTDLTGTPDSSVGPTTSEQPLEESREEPSSSTSSAREDSAPSSDDEKISLDEKEKHDLRVGFEAFRAAYVKPIPKNALNDAKRAWWAAVNAHGQDAVLEAAKAYTRRWDGEDTKFAKSAVAFFEEGIITGLLPDPRVIKRGDDLVAWLDRVTEAQDIKAVMRYAGGEYFIVRWLDGVENWTDADKDAYIEVFKPRWFAGQRADHLRNLSVKYGDGAPVERPVDDSRCDQCGMRHEGRVHECPIPFGTCGCGEPLPTPAYSVCPSCRDRADSKHSADAMCAA